MGGRLEESRGFRGFPSTCQLLYVLVRMRRVDRVKGSKRNVVLAPKCAISAASDFFVSAPNPACGISTSLRTAASR